MNLDLDYLKLLNEKKLKSNKEVSNIDNFDVCMSTQKYSDDSEPAFIEKNSFSPNTASYERTGVIFILLIVYSFVNYILLI